MTVKPDNWKEKIKKHKDFPKVKLEICEGNFYLGIDMLLNLAEEYHQEEIAKLKAERKAILEAVEKIKQRQCTGFEMVNGEHKKTFRYVVDYEELKNQIKSRIEKEGR